MSLLEKLIELQGDQSDRDFAARLRVSHTLWNQTRNKKRPLSRAIRRGALVAFPTNRELRKLVQEDQANELKAETTAR